MHNGEWSLISFTLLSQLSVGLVLALGFMYFMHQSLFAGFTTGLSLRSPEFIILVLIVIATLLSLLHLGSPLHSYQSLNNLRGSWISREILMLSMFGFGMLLFMLSRYFDWSVGISQIFIIFSMLSGILLILAMTGIYMIPTVPSWDNFYTPVSFIGSVFLLGSIGMMVFMMLSGNVEMNHKFLYQIIIFMIIVVAVLIITGGFHQYHLSQIKFTGIEQTKFNQGLFLVIFIIRIILLFVIAVSLFYLNQIIFNHDRNFSMIQKLFILVSFLILLEEVIGRYLFYGSYFRVGV